MRLVHALFTIAAVAAPAAADPALVHGAGGFMSILAVTDDGTAAVTSDVSGAVRVWPALDGTLEPVAIPAGAPRELAIARDGDGLAIAALDDAGGAELVRTTRAGAPASRTPLDAGRPATAIHAFAGGVIAVRDDQALALFDLHGKATGVLVPDPGERIAQVVVRRDRALALLVAGRRTTGRWIDVAGARWADRTPALAIDASQSAALSPDRRHLAASDRKRGVVIVDLVSGKATAHPAPPDLGDTETLGVLGFVDAHALAIVRDGQELGWWEPHGWTTPKDDTLGGGVVAVDGRLVIAADGALVLVTVGGDTRGTLGYRLIEPAIVRPTRGGLLVSDRHSIVITDGHLRQTREISVPEVADYPADVIPIDAHHAIVQSGRAGSSAGGIYQVDLDHPDDSSLVGSNDRSGMQYEPSTHLLEWQTSGAIEFARVDARTGAIGSPVDLATGPRGYGEYVQLLDPAQANGDLAVVIHEENDASGTLTPIREVTTGKPIGTGTPRTLAAGSQWWNTMSDLRVLGYDAPLRRVSPDGTLTAELARGRITLREGAKERWTIAVATARDLVWTGDGALIVVGAGLGRADLDSGELVERQCGWRFGLSDLPVASGDARLCNAP
jgi:hypothetical protein